MKNIDVLKLADEVEMWGEDLLALNMKGGIPVVQGAKMLRQQADLIRNLQKSLGFKNSGYETINLTPQLELTDEEIQGDYVEHRKNEPVGWWQITPDIEGVWSTKFAVYAPLEPKHIKNTEELLGWKWIDGKAQEK